MKIIIFDGTFKTTTFINRLIKGLSDNHQVFVMGFDEKVQQKIKNVKYVGLGSNASKLLFVKKSIQLRSFNLGKQLQLFFDLVANKKKEIQQQNIQLAINKIQPDVLHFQWVSVLSYLENLKLPKHTKTIFSQRGFHINVRPFINQKNKDFLQTVFPKINGFHSVSRAIQQKSNQLYHLNTKINKVVYSGFEYQNIPTKHNHIFSETLQILSVGRNHWIKDYKTAVLAMDLLKQQNIKFHYTIVGAEASEELLFLVHHLNLTKQVTFISNISQKEVYAYMLKSDLFLLPSVEEGIANVCIEAMFCKLLVLSTDCGGMNELIQDTETGFLVPTRNPNAMANQIKSILTLSELQIQNIIINARQKVMEQHNTNKMVVDMEALYLEVLK